MSEDKALKPIPAFSTDEEAERFVDTANLADYDLSGFKPMRFEFEKKSAQINMRVPDTLLQAVKTKANQRGIPFTRYIRMLMEQDISR
ncbi:MAG: BrnA antitoxin family protein [Alphaproteobacteria bacterium]|nr:BrnA antitoxin family protein [Alphaproteobacteria bacterium]